MNDYPTLEDSKRAIANASDAAIDVMIYDALRDTSGPRLIDAARKRNDEGASTLTFIVMVLAFCAVMLGLLSPKAGAAPINHHNASATCELLTIQNTQGYVEHIDGRWSTGATFNDVAIPVGGSTAIKVPAGAVSVVTWDGPEQPLTTLIPQCQPPAPPTVVAPPATTVVAPPTTAVLTTGSSVAVTPPAVDTPAARTPNVPSVPSTPMITTWTELPATGAGSIFGFLLLGAGLVASGIYFVACGRRKR